MATSKSDNRAIMIPVGAHFLMILMFVILFPTPLNVEAYDAKQVRSIAAQALQIATTIDSPQGRATGLKKIAYVQWRMEDPTAAARTLNQAIQSAKLIQDKGTEDMVFQHIIMTQIGIGDLEGALRVIPDMPYGKSVGLSIILSGLSDEIRAGKFERAYRVARTAEREDFQEPLLAGIAKYQTEGGFSKDAQQTIERIKNSGMKTSILVWIANFQADKGDKVEANEVLQKALSEVAVMSDSNRMIQLPEIAEVQIKLGDKEGATKSILQAKEITKTIMANPQQKIFWLIRIAKSEINAGVRNEASQDIRQALQITGTLKTETERVNFITNVAAGQADAGDIEGAILTAESVNVNYESNALMNLVFNRTMAKDYNGALRITKFMDDRKDWTLGYIASRQAEAGDLQGAMMTTRDIHIKDNRQSALIAIAIAQANAGDPTGALQTMAQVTDNYFQAWVLRQIAAAQVKAGDKRGAIKTLDKALHEANSLELGSLIEGDGKLFVLGMIAETQAKAEDVNGAIEWAMKEPTPVEKVHALAGIALGALE